jgi:hypothetical protein
MHQYQNNQTKMGPGSGRWASINFGMYSYIPAPHVYIQGFLLLINPLPWSGGGWVFLYPKLGLTQNII